MTIFSDMEGKTMFYEYRQNNSGGAFDFDKTSGISVNVIIEAGSPDEANRKAERIGLYFGGEGDCSCCGDRWYPQWDDDEGAPVPSHYGKPIDFDRDDNYGGDGLSIRWSQGSGADEGYVHYADGRIVGFN